MKMVLVVATIVGTGWVTGAGADGGGPSPGPTWGSPGVVDRAHSMRYVALPAGARNTMLTAVSTRDGNVTRWAYLKGSYGIPAAAWDWSTGGLARNGRPLILVSQPGKRMRFLVGRSARSEVRGAWASTPSRRAARSSTCSSTAAARGR